MKKYALFILLAISNCKLIYGFAMLRHGTLYPKQDYITPITKLSGQLTTVGLRQLFNLGTFIREDYINKQRFLPQQFNYQVQFFSSSLQRTQISAYAFIFGLYPLKQGPKLSANIYKQYLYPPFATLNQLRTQPSSLQEFQFALKQGFHSIPVTFLDQILDSCENYNILYAQKMKEIENQRKDFQSKNEIFIKKMKLLFSLPHSNNDIQQMANLYRAIEADQQLDIPIPEDYQEQDDRKLKYFYEYFSALKIEGKLGRIFSTLLYQQMADKFSDIAKGKLNRKMTFIVCHSSTLWPMMVNLNLTSSKCITQRMNQTLDPSQNCGVPYFGSSLIIELHQNNLTHAHFVKIKFNGYYMKMWGGKQYECPLQEFLQKLKDTEQDYDSLVWAQTGKRVYYFQNMIKVFLNSINFQI